MPHVWRRILTSPSVHPHLAVVRFQRSPRARGYNCWREASKWVNFRVGWPRPALCCALLFLYQSLLFMFCDFQSLLLSPGSKGLLRFSFVFLFAGLPLWKGVSSFLFESHSLLEFYNSLEPFNKDTISLKLWYSFRLPLMSLSISRAP